MNINGGSEIKRIIMVLEALAYEYIVEVSPPNIMKLDPHPAVGWGLGSRPASGAIVGGMLPVCLYPQCYHREIKDKWASPFFLTTLQKVVDRIFLLCPNGWALELLLPWMSKEERKLNLYWLDHHELLPARMITDYFLKEKDKYNSYFALLWFFETHYPFYSPKGHDRKEALLFLDEQVGRVCDSCKDAEIIVCSDHNLPPKIVSAATDVPAPKTMLSFIASNFETTKDWKELGVDPHKIAKERWLV